MRAYWIIILLFGVGVSALFIFRHKPVVANVNVKQPLPPIDSASLSQNSTYFKPNKVVSAALNKPDENRASSKSFSIVSALSAHHKSPKLAKTSFDSFEVNLLLSKKLSNTSQTILASIVKTQGQPATFTESYVDHLINNGKLVPSILFDNSDDENYNPAGLPHYLRIEAVASTSTSTGASNSKENGFSINSQFDTQNFGEFSINGVLRTEPGGLAGSIIQRNLRFDNGWSANNGIGTLYTPSIDLARNQYRFYIPTFPILGATTEWLHKGDMQLQLSTGTPGVFDGLRLNGFTQLGGSITTGGAQWNISPQLQVGAQIVDAQNVSTFSRTDASFSQFFGLPANFDNTKTSGQSFYGAAAWRDRDTTIQGNLLQSQNNVGSSATGLWIDTKTKTGAVMQNVGLFRLDKNLSWGYTPISNDIQGAYYRANYNSRQWILDGGIDAVSSLSGAGLDGILYTGSLRYQVNHTLGLGGSATYRQSEKDAGSAYIFTDMLNKYGTGRAQLDTSIENNDQFTRLTLSQGWDLSTGARLSNSVSGGFESNAGQHINHIGAALNGGSDLFNNVSWNGNLSYDKSNGTGFNQTVSANIDLTARINNHWSLVSSYLDNRNANANLFTTQPLIPVPINTFVSTSSAFFVTLRYEDRGGTPTAPIGGKMGAAAGAISGYLFFDENDNGVSDANERPAQNVTILLDGKFSIRTDLQGRFEFPLVATGSHSIIVVSDNLPLPWIVGDSGKRTVNVSTRETSNINIPASRMR